MLQNILTRMRATLRQHRLSTAARLVSIALLCALFFEATQRIAPALEAGMAAEHAVLANIRTTRVETVSAQDP